MSDQLYDVIIVGAGPAGSYAACELASAGYRVAVLEQKEAPGLDVCCTGIISPECFDSFGIGEEVVLARANSAGFFSPSGKHLRLQTERVQAYVIDRSSFDRAIASRALSQGASYLFSCRVTDIAIGKDKTEVRALRNSTREMLTARAVILASGFKPGLSRKLGLGEIKRFAIGAQVEVEARDIDEVEIYLSQQIAPGFFAWLVPTSPDKALAGLLAPSHARSHLEKFLLSPFCRGRIIRQRTKISQKAIPLGVLPRTCGDRLLVIGDAAGQVKPTTGGGIYFGHLGAKIACGVLKEALRAGELTAARLSTYQGQWKAKMGREISLGCRARQVYARLSDRQIEGVFNMLDSGGIAEALLNSPDFSFDWHSRLILAGLKKSLTYPLQKARHLFPGEAGP